MTPSGTPKTPGPDFINIVRGYLRTYVEPHVGSSGATGDMYLGNEAPITPEVFESRLREESSAYQPNDWQLPDDVEALVVSAVSIYRAQYTAWLHAPLESGAPKEVVDWYNAGQTQS